MSITVLGLNHRTAPVELREQLAFSRDGAAAALHLFKQQFPNSEAAILSTCNRVELIVNSEKHDETALATFLSRARNVPVAAFSRHLYTVSGRQAIRHLFRVISGLDSMVLGEYQIVNQLKSAYQQAHEQGTAGAVLHRLFHHAFGVSKRVRTETALGEGKTSISSVAVDVIRRLHPTYTEERILILGAGEMAQLTARHLSDQEDGGARQLVITTRTMQNARVVAEAYRGQAVPFTELDDELAAADIVITSTTCPTSILTTSRVARAMRQREGRPLLLVDISVPRNIDADAGALTGVTLIDVDTLGTLVDAVRQKRASAVETSESIIEEEVNGFEKWLTERGSGRVGSLIEQMYADVRALAEIEVRAAFKKCPDFTDEHRHAIEQLADRLVAKLMHPCIRTVRQTQASPPAQLLADAFHDTRMNLART
jgi:glutamyl-tRNA reductase